MALPCRQDRGSLEKRTAPSSEGAASRQRRSAGLTTSALHARPYDILFSKAFATGFADPPSEGRSWCARSQTNRVCFVPIQSFHSLYLTRATFISARMAMSEFASSQWEPCRTGLLLSNPHHDLRASCKRPPSPAGASPGHPRGSLRNPGSIGVARSDRCVKMVAIRDYRNLARNAPLA